MAKEQKTYLALGDSMSIDFYTGVKGGGAVSQLYQWLQGTEQSWILNDKAADMCRMRYVPLTEKGDLITLTIGGNDLIADYELYLNAGLDGFAQEHLALLSNLRFHNPSALMIVGNVYASQSPLPESMLQKLDEANAIIAVNAKKVGAHLADIRQAFRGRENEYLCFDIEPSLKGAAVIASLFKDVVNKEKACL